MSTAPLLFLEIDGDSGEDNTSLTDRVLVWPAEGISAVGGEPQGQQGEGSLEQTVEDKCRLRGDLRLVQEPRQGLELGCRIGG